MLAQARGVLKEGRWIVAQFERHIPPAAKSRHDYAAITARVELVPFPNPLCVEFFLNV